MVEDFPQLEGLDPEEKLILAGELWKSATTPGPDSPNLSEDAVRMLEERLRHFESNPESGVRWEDLRDRKEDS